MTTNQPWTHPDRACTDEDRYVERLLTYGSGTKQERERMAKACLACSSYLDCLEDVIADGKAWELLEIQNVMTESQSGRPAGPPASG